MTQTKNFQVNTQSPAVAGALARMLVNNSFVSGATVVARGLNDHGVNVALTIAVASNTPAALAGTLADFVAHNTGNRFSGMYAVAVGGE